MLIFSLNMLIGVKAPRGGVHSAYLSSAHPRDAITTYHVFSMCAYKIDKLYNIFLAMHTTLPPHLALLPTFS